jgi:ABC-type transport system substrate-binding protein
MAPIFVTLLLAGILLPLLAACGGGGATKPLGHNNEILRINEHDPKQGDITQLDPQQRSYHQEAQIANEIFARVLTLDRDGKVVGDGAKRWTISSDGLTYTFAIRDGLKWVDGTLITARDFVDAIARSQDTCIRNGHGSFTDYYLGGVVNELLMGAQAEETVQCPKNADHSPQTRLTFSPIEGSGKAVDPVDDHTPVLRLSKPAPYFLAALT